MTLAEAPPELTHDVLETGMFLTGGGSLLKGLDMLLAQECEVPVHVVERPLETVVSGAGRMLEHLDDYRTSFQLLRRGCPACSIVAADPDAGDWGIAVASRFPCVGAVVPWAKAAWARWPHSPGRTRPSARRVFA